MIATTTWQQRERYLSERGKRVDKQTATNLLPAVLAPEVGVGPLAEVGDVLHDSVEGSKEEDFVLLRDATQKWSASGPGGEGRLNEVEKGERRTEYMVMTMTKCGR